MNFNGIIIYIKPKNYFYGFVVSFLFFSSSLTHTKQIFEINKLIFCFFFIFQLDEEYDSIIQLLLQTWACFSNKMFLKIVRHIVAVLFGCTYSNLCLLDFLFHSDYPGSHLDTLWIEMRTNSRGHHHKQHQERSWKLKNISKLK